MISLTVQTKNGLIKQDCRTHTKYIQLTECKLSEAHNSLASEEFKNILLISSASSRAVLAVLQKT